MMAPPILQARAFTLWANAHAARRLLGQGDFQGYRDCLSMVETLASIPGPTSLRHCAATTHASLSGRQKTAPRAARDVPVGTPWPFRDHPPLAALPEWQPDEPPPRAA
jgi:hypothetical protein